MKRRAFTLIELLVVLSIIALLISILLPTLERTRRATKVITCSANLKQYSLGMITYATDDPVQHFPMSAGDYVAALPIWSVRMWAVLGEPDRMVYLQMFEDVIFGGNFEAVNCPLDGAYNPTIEGSYNFGGSPEFSDVWLRMAGGDQQYWSGYRRFGNLLGRDGDTFYWQNSGNTHLDRAPVGPGSSQDCILVDRTTAEPGRRLQEPHMDWYYAESETAAVREHREVNSAYADGHVETRGGSAYAEGNFITWAEARWVNWANERLIW